MNDVKFFGGHGNLVKMTGAFEQPYDEEDAEMQTLRKYGTTSMQVFLFVTEVAEPLRIYGQQVHMFQWVFRFRILKLLQEYIVCH